MFMTHTSLETSVICLLNNFNTSMLTVYISVDLPAHCGCIVSCQV